MALFLYLPACPLLSTDLPIFRASLASLIWIRLIKFTLYLSDLDFPRLLTFAFLLRHGSHLAVPLAPNGLLLYLPPRLQYVRITDKDKVLL